MIKTREQFGELLNSKNLTGYGVELGVSGGYFSNVLLKTSRLKILFSIDRWNDHHNYQQYLKAANLLSSFKERSVVLKLTFEEAVHLFKDETFDFIYIDGYAHTGQDNGRTLREWWPKVRKGGIFAGHDYSKTSWPKTVEQVDKFAKDNNLKPEFTEENFASWYVTKI
jgi:predicted O-methyltransferase YrrM